MARFTFHTHSLHHPAVERILNAALDAVDPGAAVDRYLGSHPLNPEGRLYGLALGKAALPMAGSFALHAHPDGLLVITKHAAGGQGLPYPVLEGDHPVPGKRSLAAGQAALDFVTPLRADDLLVCLISGGGSALMAAPRVPLDDLQTLTTALLASGARIDEINLLRRRLDRLKGGGLARQTRASVLSLILSDVVRSPLETIASGPTAPDPTRREDALAVIQKYDLETSIPPSVLHALQTAPETPAPGDRLFEHVKNIIIGDITLAAKAALARARQEGFWIENLGSAWQGEAAQVGLQLARRLRQSLDTLPRPFCLVAGGETTVTIQGDGKGGRNQELALSAALELAGLPNVLLVALATDGEDGPTDAAGAVVSGETLSRLASLQLDPLAYLKRNDSYTLFSRLGDLLLIGPTGTNVNDLAFLFAF